MTEITVHELHEVLQKDRSKKIALIDVRTPSEHKEKRIKGAINIPLDQLESRKKELENYDMIFIHCRSGGRSQQACTTLKNMGYPGVINVVGGILEWEAEGFLVEKHNGFYLSIIRQSHITAGSFTLLGVILAYTLNPNWMLLSGFVGAGLLFAGATGWCGMAELLGRMPWNKN